VIVAVQQFSVVAVAQSVESRIVIPVVVGSSPIRHPKNLFIIKSLKQITTPNRYPDGKRGEYSEDIQATFPLKSAGWLRNSGEFRRPDSSVCELMESMR
jgi:hypothetical protein